jgi:hypothetical protein
MNFDHNFNAPQEVGTLLLLQASNFIANEINPICGSIFYIVLKIKREFFDKNKGEK